MLNIIKRKLFVKKEGVSLLFIPRSRSCAVSDIYKILEDTFNKYYDVHFLKMRTKHVDRCVKYNKLIIFAHPDTHRVGFLNSIDSRPLLPTNFQFEHDNLNVFGVICYGSYVLNANYWNKKTDNWSSFKSKIFLCTGISSVDNYWRGFFKSQIKIFSTNYNALEFNTLFKSKIDADIKRLERSSDIGNQTTMACISGMSRSLTKNQ